MQTEVGYKNRNEMKKIIYMLLAAFGLAFVPACGSSDDEGISPVSPIIGEWRLASWNADTEAVGTDFEAYVSFKADATFDLYQRIETVHFRHLTGSYRLDGSTLTGQYADGQEFGGAPYEVSFNAAGDTMTFISTSSVGEVQIYVRAELPASIMTTKAATEEAATADFRIL